MTENFESKNLAGTAPGAEDPEKKKKFLILCAVLGVCTIIFLVMMVLLFYTLSGAVG